MRHLLIGCAIAALLTSSCTYRERVNTDGSASKDFEPVGFSFDFKPRMPPVDEPFKCDAIAFKDADRAVPVGKTITADLPECTKVRYFTKVRGGTKVRFSVDSPVSLFEAKVDDDWTLGKDNRKIVYSFTYDNWVFLEVTTRKKKTVEITVEEVT